MVGTIRVCAAAVVDANKPREVWKGNIAGILSALTESGRYHRRRKVVPNVAPAHCFWPSVDSSYFVVTSESDRVIVDLMRCILGENSERN